MGLTPWIFDNWFTLLQSTGIIGSLWFTARSFRFDAKIRKVGNLIEITSHHREIWSQLYSQPELARVKESSPDFKKKPITVGEELFVTQVILHLRSVFRASKEGVIASLDGVEADIRQFFSKPIPRIIWNQKREFQDLDFVQFMEHQIDV